MWSKNATSPEPNNFAPLVSGGEQWGIHIFLTYQSAPVFTLLVEGPKNLEKSLSVVFECRCDLVWSKNAGLPAYFSELLQSRGSVSVVALPA